MEDLKVAIVDDSSFSVAFIRNILEENGIEVVGSAGTLEEVKRLITEKEPDLVTMDLTLPGTDGFECTRAVHEIDETIRVIIVSSMMDEEIVNKAKENRVAGYIQKPIDAGTLIAAIRRAMAVDEQYRTLENEFCPVFKESLMDTVNKLTKTIVFYKQEYPSEKEYQSAGMTIIIGIIGEFSGRMLIDLSNATADKLTAAIFRREAKNNDEKVAALGEFGNIVAGNAASFLNRKDKAFGFRVSPPSVLFGENVHISAPDFNTTSAIAQTDFGELLLNVGFRKEDAVWTQNM